jgi:two-component system nitrate/nitrite response regulator NarL
MVVGDPAPAFAIEHATNLPAAQSTTPCAEPALPLRVLVVSQVTLFQHGLALLLAQQEGVQVIGTTGLPQAAVKTAQLGPDVILFDATRPGNLEHAKNLMLQVPAAKVMAFGVAETDSEILALAAAGISGYVRDDASLADVVAAVKSTMRNELLCSPRAAAAFYHQVAVLSRNGAVAASPAPLSTRELQIAGLMDRGLSNKQIARHLGIQATTVKNHVHNILDKLNVHRRGEAVARMRADVRPPAAGDGVTPLTKRPT